MIPVLLFSCVTPSPEEIHITEEEEPLILARNTALIVIDTLRADALEKADTPNIDSLAVGGTRVEMAWAASTWTVPSVIGLLSGQSVREHGWNLPTGRLGKYPALPAVTLLPEFLADSDIKSIGIHANPYLAEELGFSRGFSVWKKSMDPAFPKQLKAELHKQGWDESTKGFVYLHFIGPHSPLKPSAEARTRHGLDDHWFETRLGLEIGAAKRNKIEGVRAAYSAAYIAVIEDTDTLVGECIDILKAHDPNIRIALTSDHGEMLGEHNVVGHGSHLYEPLSHVPLIVSEGPYPNFTSNTCLAGWFAAQYGLDWPASASCLQEELINQREDAIGVLYPDFTKYILEESGQRKTNLLSDPDELQYGASTDKRPDSFLDEIPKGLQPQNSQELSKPTREQLKELGYLE